MAGTASTRLRVDYLRLKKDPVPYVSAEPLPSNILEWHYVVKGPEESPYFGGYYHGKLVFPMEYPFRPPSIYMITPSGRFKTSTRLCLSISDFHPDTWNPAWSVATILTGLLSFMVTFFVFAISTIKKIFFKLEKSPTFGSIESSDYEKREFAKQSLTFNLKNKVFCELFPDTVEEIKKLLEEREKEHSAKVLGISSNGSIVSGSLQHNYDPGQLSAITNLVVLIGFAIFAWTVKLVINSLGEEET